MSKLVVSAVVIFVLLAGVVGFFTKKPKIAQPQPHIYTAQELLSEANKLRAEKGVAPLVLDENLNKSAQWKAQDMADRDYFAHKDPITGKNNGIGYYWSLNTNACSYVSENLETQDISVRDSPFVWWITSKPHNDAILDAKYDTTGFGAVNDNGRILYVEHFCDLK